MSEELGTAGTTRREVITKAVFVAPAILTLAAVPSFASAGSGRQRDDREEDEHRERKKPGKHPRYGNFAD